MNYGELWSATLVGITDYFYVKRGDLSFASMSESPGHFTSEYHFRRAEILRLLVHECTQSMVY